MRALATLCVSLVLAACGLGGQDPGGMPDPGGVQESPTASASPDPSPAATPSDLPAMAPFDTATLTLVDPEGEPVDLPVYVADEHATRQQGLMGVTDLPDHAGMVFLSGEDRDGGFWMKNTLIPLSIAFFAADGTILAVLDMEPCEADPCPIYDPGVTYRGALEVNQGRFAELGVDTGWRVELPAGLGTGGT